MKKILLFIFLLFISKTFSQDRYELSKNNLIKNKIEEVQIFLKGTSISYLFVHLYYDNFGNLLQEIFFNKNGSVEAKYSYKYDEKQQLVSSLDEIKNTITKYKYDEKQQLISSLDEIKNTITKYKYDKLGNRIESITVESDGTILNHDKIIFNERNQIIKIFSKKKNSNFFYLSENRFYADDGLYSRKEGFNETEKLTSTVEYEYDKNRILIFIHGVINGKKHVTKYHYNKKGELTKVEYGTGVFIKNKYDNFGNIIEEIIYNNKGKIVRNREYKYKISE